MVTEKKKNEVWSHILTIPEKDRPIGITNEKLKSIKKDIWKWNNFWMDIIQAHGLLERTPEQLKLLEKEIYNHCISNFWKKVIEIIENKGVELK